MSTPLKLLLPAIVFHQHPFSSATIFPKEAFPTKSGYLTVNSTTGSAIFYAFYEAQNLNLTAVSETPLVIWLQGGPGCSSMIGNFYELGPWRVTRVNANTKNFVLEPNPGSWNRIFGLLFLDNPIGTGFSIASTPEELPRDQEAVARHLFIAISLATYYDFTRQSSYNTDLVIELLTNPEVKKALGVNKSMVFEICSNLAAKALRADVMKSVRYKVEYVVKNTKLLLYQGQLDLLDGVESTESWVKKMKWEGIGKFLNAERDVWKVNDVLAGYVQKSDNLSHVVVLGTGHYVPTDQAVNSQAMIEDWVLDRGLFANKQYS